MPGGLTSVSGSRMSACTSARRSNARCVARQAATPWKGNGRVVLIADGCLECGTCRIICDEHRNVDWEYPRGGYGILFKFG